VSDKPGSMRYTYKKHGARFGQRASLVGVRSSGGLESGNKLGTLLRLEPAL